MANTPLRGSCSKCGRPQLKWVWPLGGPSGPLTRLGIRTIRLALSNPLGLNGFTAKYLGRARLPFRGACSPFCTFSIFLMIKGGCCLPPYKRFTLRSPAEATSKWHFFLGLPKWSPETVPVWTPGTLGVHNFLPRPLIWMRSKANL
jgi:hypothetical protein